MAITTITYPADFLSENLQIQVNLLDAAVAARVPRLVPGSSCIYPKLRLQPIPESALLTNRWSDHDAWPRRQTASILAVSGGAPPPWPAVDPAMPTNLYGPGDNFSPSSHPSKPALIRCYDEVKAAWCAQRD